MVFCVVQRDATTLHKLTGCLFLLARIRPGDTCVVAVTDTGRATIESLPVLPELNIVFRRLEDMLFHKMVSQWIDTIEFCLSEYDEVTYVNESVLLFRDIDTSQFANGIGFIKKNHVVPHEHYGFLITDEIFYCSSMTEFSKYKSILTDIRLSLEERHIEYEAWKEKQPGGDDGKDGDDGKNGDDGKDGDDAKDGDDGKNGDDAKNGDNDAVKVEPLTIKEYMTEIKMAPNMFIERHYNDSEDSCVMSGIVLCTEDFFGAASTPLSVNDVDLKKLTLRKRFCQKRGVMDFGEIEKLSVVDEESELSCFILRSNRSDERLMSLNTILVKALVELAPDVFPLFRIHESGPFPINIPDLRFQSIGIWDRSQDEWFSAMKNWCCFIAKSCAWFKITGSGSIHFSLDNVPMVCYPRIEYLTPDLIGKKHVALINQLGNSSVSSACSKVKLNTDYNTYIPLKTNLLEKFSADGDGAGDGDGDGDGVYKFSEDESFSSDEAYISHLESITKSRFVDISSLCENGSGYVGHIVAESMACGRPLIVADSSELPSLEHGVHYLFDSEVTSVSNDKWKEMSNACKRAYLDDICPTAFVKKVFRDIIGC